jgi:hypothetical protein
MMEASAGGGFAARPARLLEAPQAPSRFAARPGGLPRRRR